ncbi:hypothetical protein LIA77_03685 [Sarocladium implicatum]|nr:hypothetical protein LIA77_03685 [Sarocladium implicatum]
MRASRQRMKEETSEDNDSDDGNNTDPLAASHDSSQATSDVDSELETHQSKPQKRTRGPGRPRAQQSSSSKSATTPTKLPARSRGRSRSVHTPKRQAPDSTPSSRTPKRPKLEVQLPLRQDRIPPWTDSRIPYEAWVAIFLYASNDSNNSWLIDCATICKTFLEPALSALYRQPAPASSTKLKRLAELLKRDPSETILNYRTKIESLSLDIKDTPAKLYFPLIHPLVRLKELFIVTSLDRPPYRALDVALRWSYLDDIFAALRAGSDRPVPLAPAGGGAPAIATTYDQVVTETPTSNPEPFNRVLSLEDKPFATSLRSWEWSGRMIGGAVPSIQDIALKHQEPFFEHLTTLSFTNFQTPSMLRLANSNHGLQQETEDADAAAAQALATAISQLKSLRHLIFEACTIVDHALLPLLPTTLRQLTLINCWESLNLEFLTSLGAACPNLKELSMDLSYYRLHNSVNDSDPMYDHVLLPEQVPDWPSSLRFLSLENIKDCSAETAKMFLNSLLSNAERLKDLRHIVTKIMLNIPWQERAKMRNEWRQKMEDVFLRKPNSPINWSSYGAPLEVDDALAARKRKNHRPASPSRRSGRLSTKGRGSRNSSKRLRHKEGRLDYRDPDTDHDDITTASESDSAGGSGSRAASGTDDEGEVQYVHGMCDTVSILFDNLKPMEMQYGMEDFRDDESDSEEEWNGDDDEEDDTVFVWR